MVGFPLITQRSSVQIRPPQPTKSKGYGRWPWPFGFSPQRSLTRVARRSPGAHRRLEPFVSVRGRAHASGPMLRSGRDSGDTLVVRAVPGGGRDRKGGGVPRTAVPSTKPLCRLLCFWGQNNLYVDLTASSNMK